MGDFNFKLTTSEENKTEERERLENIKRYSYGLKFLDDATGGFTNQELILLTSKSGKGKSHLCNLIAEHNAKQGRKVLYIALEADDKEVMRRMKFRFCCKKYFNDYPSKYPLSFNKWFMGKLEDKLSRYYEAFEKEHDLGWGKNLYVKNRDIDFTKNDITTVFMNYADKVDLIILDHLHYMDFDDKDENRAMKDIVNLIRQNNLSYKIPLLLVAHLRKTDLKNPTIVPNMEDVSGSKHIINIPKTVITMSPKHEFVEDNPAITKTHMKIVKGRYLGSATNYVAELYFNSKTEEYDENYLLGNGGDYITKFEETKVLPDWYEYDKNDISLIKAGVK